MAVGEDGATTVRVAEILEATCRVIARDGAHGLHMKAVADEAGVSKALVHYYFATRQELLRRAFVHAEAQLDRVVDEQLGELGSGAERVERALLISVEADSAFGERRALWNEVWSSVGFDGELRPLMRSWYEAWLGRLVSLVEDGLADGSIPPSVDAKAGRSGTLVFVTVRHEVAGPRGLAIREEHDIVYRDAPDPGAVPPVPQPAPADAELERELVPDPVLLFRYSALTFNGHRIHYDRDYCRDVEGYPGLIVHGPLIATLLVDLVRRERPDARLTRFAFTAVRPTFDTHAFRVSGRSDESGLSLWAQDHEGFLTMRATAEVA